MTQPDPADAEDYLAADPEQLANDNADYYNDVCTPPLAHPPPPGCAVNCLSKGGWHANKPITGAALIILKMHPNGYWNVSAKDAFIRKAITIRRPATLRWTQTTPLLRRDIASHRAN
jgi:hypothetical protein